jgi:hypothetical protein
LHHFKELDGSPILSLGFVFTSPPYFCLGLFPLTKLVAFLNGRRRMTRFFYERGLEFYDSLVFLII